MSQTENQSPKTPKSKEEARMKMKKDQLEQERRKMEETFLAMMKSETQKLAELKQQQEYEYQ